MLVHISQKNRNLHKRNSVGALEDYRTLCNLMQIDAFCHIFMYSNGFVPIYFVQTWHFVPVSTKPLKRLRTEIDSKCLVICVDLWQTHCGTGFIFSVFFLQHSQNQLRIPNQSDFNLIMRISFVLFSSCRSIS